MFGFVMVWFEVCMCEGYECRRMWFFFGFVSKWICKSRICLEYNMKIGYKWGCDKDGKYGCYVIYGDVDCVGLVKKLNCVLLVKCIVFITSKNLTNLLIFVEVY